MRHAALVLVLMLFGGAPKELYATSLYWTDQQVGRIIHANLDGSSQQFLLNGLADPTGIAIDAFARKIYWADQAPDSTVGRGPGGVFRSNLDGTQQELLIPRGSLSWIALDLSHGELYWTSPIPAPLGFIGRSRLDGTDPQLVATGLETPTGIALDVAAGKMYWASDLGGAIFQANLDGSGQRMLFGGLPRPMSIALDATHQQLYWTDWGGEIGRANLDGSGSEILVSGLLDPLAITLDTRADSMYWTSSRPGATRAIWRANLDGGGAAVLIPGQPFPIDPFPTGLALQLEPDAVPEPVTSCMVVIGVAMLIGVRRYARIC